MLVLAVALTVIAVRDRSQPVRLRTVSPPTAAVAATRTALLVDGGYDQVTINNLDAGTTRTVTLPGKVPGDYPYDVLAVDGWIVYPAGDGTRSIRSDFTGAPVPLGRTSLFVPSARSGWVWLVDATGGTATVTVQEVRVDGSQSGRIEQLPSGTSADMGVPGGLLVSNDRWSSVWNQSTGRLGPQLVDGNGLIDVHGDLVARGIGCGVDSTCDSVRVQNLATGAHRDILAPPGTTGWIPTVGEGSRDAFSADGRYLAVRAGGAIAAGANHPSDSRVYVIDLDNDGVKQVTDSKTNYAFSRVGWSPDGGWVFYETTSHSVGGYRPSDGTSTSFHASCCGVALAALPTPMPAHGKIVGTLTIATLARSSRVRGTVTLLSRTGEVRTFATTSQGTFAIDVAPGNYEVTGHTPGFTVSVNGGPSTEGTCRASPTAVAANAIVHVEVICVGR
jgi:hypothetical protein